MCILDCQMSGFAFFCYEAVVNEYGQIAQSYLTNPAHFCAADALQGLAILLRVYRKIASFALTACARAPFWGFPRGCFYNAVQQEP